MICSSHFYVSILYFIVIFYTSNDFISFDSPNKLFSNGSLKRVGMCLTSVDSFFVHTLALRLPTKLEMDHMLIIAISLVDITCQIDHHHQCYV